MDTHQTDSTDVGPTQPDDISMGSASGTEEDKTPEYARRLRSSMSAASNFSTGLQRTVWGTMKAQCVRGVCGRAAVEEAHNQGHGLGSVVYAGAHRGCSHTSWARSGIAGTQCATARTTSYAEKDERRYATRAAVKKQNPNGAAQKKKTGSSRTTGDDDNEDL